MIAQPRTTEPRTTHRETDALRTTNLERHIPRTTHVERRTSKRQRSEPLFDARETTALQRLIADVRDARVDLTPLAKEGPMPLPAMDPLVISPIVIEPLTPSGIEGERP
jgi:hypothetical protein